MRAPSKRVARTELERAQRERDLAERALSCVVTECPEATEIHGEDAYPELTYRLDLYRSAAADGGIVVQVFHCPGQRDSVRAFRLDEMTGGAWCLPRVVALDRLCHVRNRIAMQPFEVQP